MWNQKERDLKSQLSAGESLLWSGEPKQGLLLRPSDAYAIPFSLLWGGFAIFWNVTVNLSGSPIFFRLWGLPFLVIGLHMIVGRFFVDAWQRRKTQYGVTNERVIIFSGLLSRNTKSISLRTLTDLTINERRDGSGTITFGPANAPSSYWGMRSSLSWGQNVVTTPEFECIPNAKRVYDLIRDAQSKV